MYRQPRDNVLQALRRKDFLRRDFGNESLFAKLSVRHQGTCEWILKDPKFVHWSQDSSCRLLWIHGPPGAGKSVLAQYILSQLTNVSTDVTAPPVRSRVIPTYHFFSKDEPDSRSVDSVLRGLVCQLLEADATLLAAMPKQFWRNEDAPYDLNGQDCAAFIRAVIERNNGPYVRMVIDGIDEAFDNSVYDVRMLVSSFLSCDKRGRLKVCLTDRNPVSLASPKAISAETHEAIAMLTGGASRDVERYIEDQMMTRLESRSVPSDLVDEVIATLIEVSEGTFLHAKLAMEYFTRKAWMLDRAMIMQCLRNIKQMTPALETWYCELLNLIPENYTEYARRMFAIVLSAYVPFSTDRVQYALTINEKHSTLEDVDRSLPFDFVKDAPRLFGFVLVFDDGPVRFTHKSASDLFDNAVRWPENKETLAKFKPSKRERHTIMTTVCLNFLQLQDFTISRLQPVIAPASELGLLCKTDPRESNTRCSQILQSLQHYPLLLYALLFWDQHFGSCQDHPSLVARVSKWLRTQDMRYLSLCRRCVQELIEIRSPENGNILHARLVRFGKVWSEEAALGDLGEETDITPLHLALEYGDFPAVVARLLQEGEDPNTLFDKRTPICTALSASRIQTASMLLDRADVSLSLPDTDRQRQALTEKRDKIATSLKVIAAQERIEDDMSSPFPFQLSKVPRLRLSEIEKRHERKPANIESIVEKQFLELKSLLTAASDGPLHCAMNHQMLADPECAPLICRLLSDPRTDLNASGRDGDTALHRFLLYWDSTMENYHGIWEVLLKKSAMDITMANQNGKLPLDVAVRYRRNEAFAIELLQELWHRRANSPLDNATFRVNVSAEILLACEVNGWKQMQSEILKRVPSLVHRAMDNGHTILTQYAAFGQEGELRNIIRQLPEKALHGKSTVEWNLINVCAHQGWKDLVWELLTKQRLTPSRCDHWQRTILHWAVENEWDGHGFGYLDDWELARLVEKDLIWDIEEFAHVDVNAQDKDGRTALHIAAETGYVDAAQWLLDRGANFLLCDKYGKNSAHVAAEVYCRRIINMVFDSNVREYGRDHQGRGFLHFLVAWADQEFVIEAIVKKRMLVDITDRARRTPLHYAVMHSNIGSTLALLSRGAAINKADNNYCTALHYAIRNGNLELIELLQAHGADFQRTNLFDQTCWQIGMLSARPKVVECFLRLKLSARDVSRADNFGRTPFYYLCQTMCSIAHLEGAAHAELWEAARASLSELQRIKATVNASGHDGTTPLHVAVRNDSVDLATLLLQKFHAEPSLADCFGCSPLDWATAMQSQQMINVLTLYGGRHTTNPKGMKLLQGYFPSRNLEEGTKDTLGQSLMADPCWELAEKVVNVLNRHDRYGVIDQLKFDRLKQDIYCDVICLQDEGVYKKYNAIEDSDERLKYLLEELTDRGYITSTLDSASLEANVYSHHVNRGCDQLRPEKSSQTSRTRMVQARPPSLHHNAKLFSIFNAT